MKKYVWVVLLVGLSPAVLLAGLRVVTTTEDLADLTRQVGGNLVDVSAIAKGYQDPHFVDPKPSYLLKLKKADLFIQVGLELEVGWAPSLLTSARNSKILPGSPGFLDTSQGCDILQKTQGQVDRSQGDVHPFGNPHFWLDPGNGRVMASHIAEKLAELDPSHAKDYQEGLKNFEARMSGKEKEWEKTAALFRGLKVVTYHNSWPNFVKRFGLEVVNYVEPKPGVPPSPAHVQLLIEQMKKDSIKLILLEPYFDAKLPSKIAREAGARVLVFAPSIGAEKNIKTYFDLFDYDLKLLADSLDAKEKAGL